MKSPLLFSWLRKKAGWTDKNVRHSPMEHCLNCKADLQLDDHYCRSCGQKIHESKLTFWSLISEFFAGIFNLENGFYSSMSRIFFPSYLSREFIQGRRKRYLNPIRFFVVTLLIHLAVINLLLDTDDIGQIANNALEEIGKAEIYDSFLAQKDSLTRFGLEVSELDSLEEVLFKGITPSDRDTFLSHLNVGFTNTGKYAFLKKDIYEVPIDSLLTKYEVNTFKDRLVVTQMVRSIRDLPGVLRFMIGNIVWGVIVSILILALLMKLLYIRRKSFYVEHIIVLCHIHAFAFLIASIGFLCSGLNFNDVEGTGFDFSFSSYIPISIAYTLISIYFLLTLKKYYSQGWFKSTIKFLIIVFAYIMIISFVVIILLFTSLVFFK
ncbi:MAG: hypothetical protein ACI9FN_000318 [Saprospiraceae bacterium]|jgi:hypothetical protein